MGLVERGRPSPAWVCRPVQGGVPDAAHAGCGVSADEPPPLRCRSLSSRYRGAGQPPRLVADAAQTEHSDTFTSVVDFNCGSHWDHNTLPRTVGLRRGRLPVRASRRRTDRRQQHPAVPAPDPVRSSSWSNPGSSWASTKLTVKLLHARGRASRGLSAPTRQASAGSHTVCVNGSTRAPLLDGWLLPCTEVRRQCLCRDSVPDLAISKPGLPRASPLSWRAHALVGHWLVG